MKRRNVKIFPPLQAAVFLIKVNGGRFHPPLSVFIRVAEQERVEPAQNAAFACFFVHRRYNTTSIIASSSPKIFAKDAILGARQF